MLKSMKKSILLILLLTLSISSMVFSAGVTFTTPTPKYGCPNTTQSVTIGATNTSGISLPSTVVITVNVVFKDNTNTNVLGSSTQTFNGLANGATLYVTIPSVAFVGPMVTNVTGSVSFNYLGPQNFPISTTYTVQYPQDLSASESPQGTIALSTPLNGYSVQYFLNADYATVNSQSTSTTYTPGVGGSYTAKAYDPITACISVNPSNAVVIKDNDQITFPMLSPVSLGDADFAPGASSTNAGVAITYISSDPSVATIVSGNIHIVGPGTVTITAQQAGDATYYAATDVPQSLVVKYNQQITFPVLSSATTGDVDFSPGATSTNTGIAITYTSDNTSVATIVSGNIHIVGAGTATITAHQAGDANYSAAIDVSQSLNVSAISTGINNALNSAVMIYPNPASDFVYVELDNSNISEAELTLTDIMGLEISKVSFSKEGNSLKVKLGVGQLAEGIYLLYIQSDVGAVCKKITKK
jgi:hypothetical protein